MSQLLAIRRVDFTHCTEVTLACPVKATTLGYVPNLGSNIFFTLAFGLCLLAALSLGLWKRTWTYCAAISVGVLLECVGYIGRILMHHNVWDRSGFKIQICCIILGPTFICAAIYLTLKHISLALNPSLSRIPPVWYPRAFLPADISCLIVQAIGGGIAASASGGSDKSKADAGNQTIMAGVVLQVVVLVLFGLVATDYFVRVRRYIHGPDVSDSAMRVWKDGRFRQFGGALTLAYCMILIRCIYRIVEMAGGWGNHIMQDEPSFLVLDGGLVLIGSALLTIFHPGLFFPQMSNGGMHEEEEVEKASSLPSTGVVESS